VLVTAVEATPLRSLTRARIELGPGIVSLVGPNGIGKTNLLEALYFALTGRSFRTADRRLSMARALRLIFARAGLHEPDVHLLRGVIKQLARGGPPRRDGG